MPKGATTEQRVAWHREHQNHCGCRPVPASLAAAVAAGTKRSKGAAGSDVIDPRFAPVVAAFAGDREVTYGGKGFGSTALKVGGKIFAMISAPGELVVKLPRPRVDELVAKGEGERFDPGHGRVMKEWLAAPADTPRAVELAREARRFVAGDRT